MSLQLHSSFSVEEILQKKDLLHNRKDFAFCSFPSDGQARQIHFFSDEQVKGPNAWFTVSPFSLSEKKGFIEMSEEQHAAIVDNALNHFRSTDLKKVVISRLKKIKLSKSISEWLMVYESLCKAYSNAAVYWLQYKNEMWIGASPELLLRKRNNSFQTVSLAGTQVYKGSIALEKLEWGEKEKTEQQLVTDYIYSTLRQIGATAIRLVGPYTSPAGKLAHLKTEVSFDYAGEMEVLLNALHPTPAVCGLPLDLAKQFIQTHEPHSRSLYTGYLGMLHGNGDVDFYVNLRCMSIIHDEVTLFAGGGVVEGSVAEKEWEETEKKMEVMLNYL